MCYHGFFQIKPKFGKIEQSPAGPEQNPAKKKAWISLDFLRRIEPFQWLALTPWAKKFFSFSFPPGNGFEPRRAGSRVP